MREGLRHADGDAVFREAVAGSGSERLLRRAAQLATVREGLLGGRCLAGADGRTAALPQPDQRFLPPPAVRRGRTRPLVGSLLRPPDIAPLPDDRAGKH